MREQVGAGEERVGGGHAHDAQQHQHRDQAEVARRGAVQQPAQRVGRRRGLARGLLHPALLVDGGHGRHRRRSSGSRRCAQPCAVPSITRSSTRLSSRSALGAVCTTRPSRTTSTRSARPSTSGTSLDTRTTATPESASRGSGRRSRCARRRRRRGSARRAAARRSPAAASGPAPPSAGCRRTACAPAGWGRAVARRAARSPSPTADSSASRPRKPARANRRSAGSETLRDTGSASSRPWLLRSSGHSPMPGPHRRRHGARPQRPPVHADRARGRPAGAVDGLQDLRAPRPDQARPGRPPRRPAP